MIVRNNKSYETNSLFPNLDWYDEGNYIVDETSEEGKILAVKIKKNYPHFELVIVDNEIVDIEVTEENKNEKLAEQIKVTYTLPNISREKELIALQTLEIEDLKDEIKNIRTQLGGK